MARPRQKKNTPKNPNNKKIHFSWEDDIMYTTIPVRELKLSCVYGGFVCLCDGLYHFFNNNHRIETLKTVSKNIPADLKVAYI